MSGKGPSEQDLHHNQQHRCLGDTVLNCEFTLERGSPRSIDQTFNSQCHTRLDHSWISSGIQTYAHMGRIIVCNGEEERLVSNHLGFSSTMRQNQVGNHGANRRKIIWMKLLGLPLPVQRLAKTKTPASDILKTQSEHINYEFRTTNGTGSTSSAETLTKQKQLLVVP